MEQQLNFLLAKQEIKVFRNLTNHQLKSRFYFFYIVKNPLILKINLFILKCYPFLKWFLQPIIKKSAFSLFFGGETLKDVKSVSDNLAKNHIYTILDPALEAKENPKQWEKSKNIFIESIEYASTHKYIPFVSIKLSSMISSKVLLEISNSSKPLNERNQLIRDTTIQYFDEICFEALKNKVSVLIDAEESWLQDPIDNWTLEMVKKYNKKFPTVYFTVQLYRKDKLAWLKKFYTLSKKKNFIPAVKIVRGAYMEKERKRAKEMKLSDPIFSTKEGTDQSFFSGLEYCLDYLSFSNLIIATHNINDIIHSMKKLSVFNKDIISKVYFSQLYGMKDPITMLLGEMKMQTAKYVPFGKMKDSLPYLVRRALENSSMIDQIDKEIKMIKLELKRRKASYG